MKAFDRITITVLIFIAILLVPFICVHLNFPYKEFWEGVQGNMATTMFVLIAGIPIALWIDRFIKSYEKNRKYLNERKREKEILILVRDELDYSYNFIFLKGMKGNAESLNIEPLKSELWEALISGDNTKYIEVPKTLDSITSAYHILRTVKNMQAQAYSASRTSAIRFTLDDGSKYNAAQMILRDARTLDSLFESTIQKALRNIDKRLKMLDK